MGFDLPSLVWKPLVGEAVSIFDLECVDTMAARTLRRVVEHFTRSSGDAEVKPSQGPGDERQHDGEGEQEDSSWVEELRFTVTLSDGREVSLLPQNEGFDTPVDASNWQEFVRAALYRRLTESEPLIRHLMDGLASVLPVEIFPLFTPEELERILCGSADVDVDLLQQCTEYEEVNPTDPHIQYFWEVIREMRPDERTDFLRFVWARSRMPSTAKDFPMNFKLQAQQAGTESAPDLWLPHAQTCFFSLSLPRYTSKEILRSKLLFAIRNSPNMDADVRLHSAEGWGEA